MPWIVSWINQNGFPASAEFGLEEQAIAYAQERGYPAPVFVEAIAPAPATTPEFEPDWINLESRVRGSAFFNRAYSAGDESLPAQNAFTLLLATISKTHEIQDLVFGFNRLRQVLPETTTGDYTSEELEAIVQLLTDCHFPLDHFNLA